MHQNPKKACCHSAHGDSERVEAKFYFSLLWSIPLFSHMFLDVSLLHKPYFQLLLCIPLFVVGLGHFGKSALKSLRSGAPNMDVLITIGFTSAFIYSFVGTVFNLGSDYLFYETSAVIISLVLLGNLLEHKSLTKTTQAVKELSSLQPNRATRLIEGNQTEEIGYEQIQLEDILLVNTGDTVPVDGIVTDGDAAIDESMLSGEPLPQDKTVGDSVVGGTVITAGNIRIKASAIGNNTVLAQIIRMVELAQSSKPEIQKWGDRVSAIFVPVVLFISLLTLVISGFILELEFYQALLNSIAVLVISCPCAMGLATPTAVVVGIGKAAKKGILIKSGAAVEQFAEIKRIVFDKTGTLTEADFEIEEIDCLKYDRQKTEEIVLGLERFSSHPVAKAIVATLSKRDAAKFTEVRETKGIGLEAQDSKGDKFQLGSARILPSSIKPDQYDLFLLENSELIARIKIGDRIKPDAKASIDFLKQEGIKLAMLSGDRSQKCQTVAHKLGIEEVYAEKLPQEKLDTIKELQNESPLAFVGDGVNDAAALAQSNVGVSLGSATRLATETSQVVLLNSNLASLSEAYLISRLTLRTIKQNLFWALIYNVVAIPVAACGFLNPMVAALTMAFSDVIVIGNSLRLRSKRLSYIPGANENARASR